MAFPKLLSKLFTNSGAGSKLNPGLASSLPIGAITAFSGNFDSAGHPISSGTADTSWRLCDGGDGTPDLRGRFVLGVSDGHSAGQTGGEATHTLTEAEMPAHKHSANGWPTTPSQQGSNFFVAWGSDGAKDWSGTRVTTKTWGPAVGYTKEQWGEQGHDMNNQLFAYQADRTTFPTGGGAAHNNMPPYYALSFIMKIA